MSDTHDKLQYGYNSTTTENCWTLF